jgi:hypothetical protein
MKGLSEAMLLVAILVFGLVGIGLFALSSYFTNRSYYWQDKGDESKSEKIQKFAFVFRWLIGLDILAFIVFLMANFGR